MPALTKKGNAAQKITVSLTDFTGEFLQIGKYLKAVKGPAFSKGNPFKCIKRREPT